MDDPRGGWKSASEQTIAQSLERGQVVHYPVCPFALPGETELQFLRVQRLGSRAHKNIGYDPHTEKVTGNENVHDPRPQLRNIFGAFSREVTRWASTVLPRYARSWRLDRVSYRPAEEATRKLRRTARNDLLHVDAFPSRPTNGWRILRIFVNINPSADRVWVTSDPFARLLANYGRHAGLPHEPRLMWPQLVREGFSTLIRVTQARRSPYDAFMLRLHNWLKASDDFQQNCPKRLWHFGPGACWMAITDTASHAVLGGRFALEHSYFLSPDSLALPDEAPAALLRRACGTEVLRAAA